MAGRDHDQVVIVGAGLCGLVAAVELHQRGIPCVVIEAADRPGGRIRTIRFPDGAVAEAGMEEFWETSPAYELLRRLALPLVEDTAWSSVMLDGRLSAYSAGLGSDPYFEHLFPGPTAHDFARWNVEAWSRLDEFESGGTWDRDRARWSAAGSSDFATFVEALNLPPRLRSWIRVHVETESAIEWNRIATLDGLHEMLPFLVPRAGSATPRAVRVSGGNIGLVEALLARLPPDTVRLGTRAVSVSAVRRGSGAEVGCTTGDGRVVVVRGHHAVVTTPIWTLASIDVDPPLRDGARAALGSTCFGSYVKVVLRLRPADLCVWEPDGDHPFTLLTDGPAGCIYLTDGRPDDRDHVLTMLVHGRWARAITGCSHARVVAHTIGALERLDVADGRHRRRRTPLLHGIRSAITSSVVVDHPRAVAYWPHRLGRSRFDQLADDLRGPHGRILIGGDTTDTSHSDGAVRAGLRMARVIAERIGQGVRVPA